jgi:hypothetical protein
LGLDIFIEIPSQECIIFHDAADTMVEDADINGSAAAGLIFARCIRPSVNRAMIKNTMADGLHFSNCQDAVARNITLARIIHEGS